MNHSFARRQAHTQNAGAEQHPFPRLTFTLSKTSRVPSAKRNRVGKHRVCARVEPLPGEERQVSHGDEAAGDAVELLSPCAQLLRHGTGSFLFFDGASTAGRRHNHRPPVDGEWKDDFRCRQSERGFIFVFYRVVVVVVVLFCFVFYYF